jgi:hypothetical protein
LKVAIATETVITDGVESPLHTILPVASTA